MATRRSQNCGHRNLVGGGKYLERFHECWILSAPQGMSKLYRFTLVMPACVTVGAMRALADHITDEPHRPPYYHVHAAGRGARDDLEFAGRW